MVPDPKWLEILKASGWQLLAICLACSGFIMLAQLGVIPKLDPWMVQAAGLTALVTGALVGAAVISAIFRFFPPKPWMLHWVGIWRERRWLRRYIPNMTPEERLIIAYLLDRNQRTFIAEASGGNAMTLISHKIVVRSVQAGQVFDLENVPFSFPDHIWAELQRHKDQFPFDENTWDGTHPWRIDWRI